MTYNNFIDTIISGFTYLTTTGKTDVIYIERTLEDLIEIQNSYPGNIQSGKSVWICPIPMSLDTEDVMSYSCRVYIAQQIKEDSSDRFSAISSCIDLVQMIVQWLPDNWNGVSYPVNITPILSTTFDATVEGLFFDITLRTADIPCL